MNRRNVATICTQIGNRSDEKTGAVSAPIYHSTAYRHEGIGCSTGYDYARTKNPTRALLEEGIAELEGGDGGFACSSGMAAIQLVLTIFEPGDDIVATSDIYGGTYRLFEEGWRKWGLTFQYGDPRNPDMFRRMITEKTKALFIETPTNPLMQEADLSVYKQMAEEHGLYLIVDNTFYTPLIQRPIDEGADIVIHSASKYLAGHNDVIAGLVAAKGEKLCERLAFSLNSAGQILSPNDSWLVMRGIKTLPVRMKQHEENAKEIAAYLESHASVSEVIYPGRGGMLSFRVNDEACVDPFLRNLELITFAESLGGVESLLTYPATQTHADVPQNVREAIGVDNCLLRYSVGIESAADLIADMDYALEKAEQATTESSSS
ncbi:methionine biosynthesis PLP-dependent protein [Salisediminibacterium halotolerans]|uniref:methionine biosynthesis PLP-dependent protein n=1 Tax=Salisediminibacterium halotolerans TaxID=517425 RepID=UPI000EB36761|nr:methionine biosynthesis PLP-dependent protein [Salisediminibacterium halotolerans]RLJ73241.1 cysteine synthase /cystathionine gamma-synthase [Actinophytocola xinjiangensis]RPE86663.1 cystathionine gamma-synthase [Salisediminibacterium halotolerans]TWG34038.1 cystathionine gamma-synthase [Salisediminibacterium halotolerans]GEL08305.1 cystathionine gamma-synthase [Salisediminibacterium halotolerans]